MKLPAILFVCATMLCAVVAAKAQPLDKPVPAKVLVRHDGKPPEMVNGSLTQWDDDSLTIKTKTDDRLLHWVDLTGASAYALRSQLIKKEDGPAWLKLGALAWGLNDISDAKVALANAARLDPSLKDDVDAVLASGAGILLEGPELLQDLPPEEANASAAPVDPRAPKPKYHKSSPAQAKAAMSAVRDDARKVSADMKIDLKEVETDHFLIFTDWDPREYNFLRDNLEAAYACVSRQFDIPVNENVFVGKLGVFMFARHDDFLHFGVKYDHIPPDRTKIAGYYAFRGAVLAHMAMSKPKAERGSSQAVAEKEWAYVLTHEFTHAFVARYRSGRRIPVWLNEGIAEVIASSQFPVDVRAAAVAMAKKHRSIASLFSDDATMPDFEMYPVMRTVTELLIHQDRAKFLQMFDEIKAGATGAQALQDNYGCTFAELEAAWRQSLR